MAESNGNGCLALFGIYVIGSRADMKFSSL